MYKIKVLLTTTAIFLLALNVTGQCYFEITELDNLIVYTSKQEQIYDNETVKKGSAMLKVQLIFEKNVYRRSNHVPVTFTFSLRVYGEMDAAVMFKEVQVTHEDNSITILNFPKMYENETPGRFFHYGIMGTYEPSSPEVFVLMRKKIKEAKLIDVENKYTNVQIPSEFFMYAFYCVHDKN